jgi:hypothetical protein
MKNEMDRTCGTYGRGAYRGLLRRAEQKKPLGRLRHRWEDNY